MSATENAWKQGQKDAAQGKGPKDVKNQPSQTQNSYNAGYNSGKK